MHVSGFFRGSFLLHDLARMEGAPFDGLYNGNITMNLI